MRRVLRMVFAEVCRLITFDANTALTYSQERRPVTAKPGHGYMLWVCDWLLLLA
ncbi:hypothetical protein JOF28_000301 [Leucobacter exalbidus]|uniref:Transposase n=1 Tax=Leucobacter exalbidus TaxID=662960 RepID=A0A940PP87_9MICO|nr:hypothetical protein [Leucobacter exalbidus]